MKKYSTLIIIICVFIVVGVGLYKTGVLDLLTLDNLPLLREKFLNLGVWSAGAFILLYALGTLFMLPGTPLTILGAGLFGALWGTLYTIIGASLGMALSFLAAKYAVRDLIYDKFGSSDAFKKIDTGVKEEGWRILMITRLVPIFPFSLQNYVYGLTDINFFLYWGLSTLFIIPGTSAYTLSAGAVLSGEFSTTNLIYLGIGAICFVAVSFLPKLIQSKSTKTPSN